MLVKKINTNTLEGWWDKLLIYEKDDGGLLGMLVLVYPCRSAQLDLDPRLFSWLTSLQRLLGLCYLMMTDGDFFLFYADDTTFVEINLAVHDVWITSYLIRH